MRTFMINHRKREFSLQETGKYGKAWFVFKLINVVRIIYINLAFIYSYFNNNNLII